MADIYDFMRKYMKDVRDSQSLDGGFPSYAPFCQYGPDKFKLGWADAGVIVPWTMWKQFGDERIINENWEAMSKFVRRIDEEKYDFEGKIGYIFADWLSFDKYETCGNRYGHWGKWRNHPDAMNFRRFLAACYWLYDSRLMVEMALATQRASEADFFRQCEARALLYIRNTFLEKDGLLLKPMRDMQTACAFALKFGIVEGEKKTETLRMMIELIEKNGWCLATGFLGTNFLMDVLAEEGRFDIAYSLLLQHKNPSWLYSVDQGATTVWERWDSYTKEYGFGAASMNSFNHYAYGAVVGWVYRHVAGICSSSSAPGFKKIVLSPNPSRRIGWIDAAYKTKFGIIESSWKFTGEVWEWNFTIPEGTSAEVIVPGDAKSYTYLPGRYTVRRKLP
jgi:alpha-L-rhamnosidase